MDGIVMLFVYVVVFEKKWMLLCGLLFYDVSVGIVMWVGVLLLVGKLSV